MLSGCLRFQSLDSIERRLMAEALEKQEKQESQSGFSMERTEHSNAQILEFCRWTRTASEKVRFWGNCAWFRFLSCIHSGLYSWLHFWLSIFHHQLLISSVGRWPQSGRSEHFRGSIWNFVCPGRRASPCAEELPHVLLAPVTVTGQIIINSQNKSQNNSQNFSIRSKTGRALSRSFGECRSVAQSCPKFPKFCKLFFTSRWPVWIADKRTASISGLSARNEYRSSTVLLKFLMPNGVPAV